jgi:hypothetical protein
MLRPFPISSYESPKQIKLYDWTSNKLVLDETEKTGI